MAAPARGRGRGKISGPVTPLRKPGEPPKPAKDEEETFASLTKLINEFSLNPSDDLLQHVSIQFEAYICTSDSNTSVPKVVEHLYQKGLAKFANPAAQIANMLSNLENTGTKFRGLFLKRTQELYKTREATREKSVEEWMGLVGFICETFNVIRISDAPLKPLAGAVYQVLTELLTLDGRTDEEVDCCNHQLRTVGKTLQSVDEAKMDNLVKTIRDTIITDENSSPQTRCLLLEMLELYWSGWNLKQDIQCYYCDMMADVMAAQS